MFEQDFHSQKAEDDTACKLGFALVFCAEEIADINTAAGKNKRRCADEDNRLQNIDFEKGKRNADGQCVDARCDRHDEKLFDAQVRFFFTFRIF